MKVSENLIKKLQEGGQIPTEPAPEPAPATPQGDQGGNPLEQAVQMGVQALQSGDGQLALQAWAIFIDAMQQQQGGGQEPAPSEPLMQRKGGKLVVKKRL